MCVNAEIQQSAWLENLCCRCRNSLAKCCMIFTDDSMVCVFQTIMAFLLKSSHRNMAHLIIQIPAHEHGMKDAHISIGTIVTSLDPIIYFHDSMQLSSKLIANTIHDTCAQCMASSAYHSAVTQALQHQMPHGAYTVIPYPGMDQSILVWRFGFVSPHIKVAMQYKCVCVCVCVCVRCLCI